MRVAVIGAGVFGSVIAWKLAEKGVAAQIFDSKREVLRGTTPKSVLRLHLGLHYPRDLGTAIQSRQGYERFLSEFGDTVDFGFRNLANNPYYAEMLETCFNFTFEVVNIDRIDDDIFYTIKNDRITINKFFDNELSKYE
jgi:flavin-dependent dehydrogenase